MQGEYLDVSTGQGVQHVCKFHESFQLVSAMHTECSVMFADTRVQRECKLQVICQGNENKKEIEKKKFRIQRTKETDIFQCTNNFFDVQKVFPLYLHLEEHFFFQILFWYEIRNHFFACGLRKRIRAGHGRVTWDLWRVYGIGIWFQF